jgi:hypothetical protein
MLWNGTTGADDPGFADVRIGSSRLRIHSPESLTARYGRAPAERQVPALIGFVLETGAPARTVEALVNRAASVKRLSGDGLLVSGAAWECLIGFEAPQRPL